MNGRAPKRSAPNSGRSAGEELPRAYGPDTTRHITYQDRSAAHSQPAAPRVLEAPQSRGSFNPRRSTPAPRGAFGDLDLQTNSDHWDPVSFSVVPTAREATVTRRRSKPRVSRTSRAPSPLDNLAEDAARRGHREVRRYAVANGLRYLVTLTYRDVVALDRERLWKDVANFVRRLKRHVQTPFPYVAVVEDQGSRPHIHVLLGFGDCNVIRHAWGGRGSVDVRPPNKFSSIRSLAGYITKGFKGAYGLPGHRYRTGRGFKPEVISGSATNMEEAREAAIVMMGGEIPEEEWATQNEPGWPSRHMYWPELGSGFSLANSHRYGSHGVSRGRANTTTGQTVTIRRTSGADASLDDGSDDDRVGKASEHSILREQRRHQPDAGLDQMLDSPDSPVTIPHLDDAQARDRQPDEPPKALQELAAYRDLGPSRTLGVTASQAGVSRDRALQVSDDVDATGNARAWLRRAFPDSEVVEGEVCASVLPIAHLDRCVICGALVVPAPASLRHGWSTVCRSCSEAKLDAKLLGVTR